MTLSIVPITFGAACEFVDAHHRHHKRPVGHKFSIGCTDETGELVGVVMVGRPVARNLDDGLTAEVNRSCVLESARNANSMLYAAAWRAAKAMGYRKLITYTQGDESGASLRGAGWTVIGERSPRKGWDSPSRERPNEYDSQPRLVWQAAQPMQRQGGRSDALAAIDALGTDAPDQPARRPLAYDPAAKDNRP